MFAPRQLRIALLFVLCVSVVGCKLPTNSSGARSDQHRTSFSDPQSRAASAHDLSIDERRGGHTLSRHVGLSDSELQQRLEREPNISAASTYTDRATAEHAVGTALAENSTKIQRWMARGVRRPNLVLDYTSDLPLGRTLHRGEPTSANCERAVVVLKSDGPESYHVLTSYPECP